MWKAACQSGILLLVLQKKRSDKDKVGSLFDQARKAGAEAGTSDDMVNPNAPFRGTGRTVAGGQSQVLSETCSANDSIRCMHANNLHAAVQAKFCSACKRLASCSMLCSLVHL